jgi:hypothetical protein
MQPIADHQIGPDAGLAGGVADGFPQRDVGNIEAVGREPDRIVIGWSFDE